MLLSFTYVWFCCGNLYVMQTINIEAVFLLDIQLYALSNSEHFLIRCFRKRTLFKDYTNLAWSHLIAWTNTKSYFHKKGENDFSGWRQIALLICLRKRTTTKTYRINVNPRIISDIEVLIVSPDNTLTYLYFQVHKTLKKY